MKRHAFIGSVRDAARETNRITSTQEALGEAAKLTDALGRFVVYHERLPPGRRASSPHSHSRKDELVFVLSGAPEVWIDGESFTLAAGDYVSFAAVTGVAHYITNTSGDTTAEYLVVASVEDDDTVTYVR